jgi:exopolysaccharide biosynthesis polyprenyl glycosylphosphotransferase
MARLTGLVSPPLEKVLGFWILAVSLVTAGRVVARVIVRSTWRRGERTIIVGAGHVGQLVAEKLMNHPEYGVDVIGFVDSAPRHPLAELTRLRTLGSPRALPAIVAEHDVERILIAFSLTSDEELLPAVREVRKRGVRIDVVPRFFEVIGPRALVDDVEGLTTMSIPPGRRNVGVDRLKRGFDVVAASVALIVLSPLLAAIALLVTLDSRGPVLYRHRRIGLSGRPFDLFKFRTMRLEYCRGERYGGEAAEEAFAQLLADDTRREEFERSYKLSGDPRVTRIGHFLRGSSLDELPQLINVVRGDISLVGPRPITEDELERYGDLVDVLLGVRPGITGYWQINGRSNTDYHERVRLDLAYLMDRSLGLDLKILARTPHALRSRNGAC